MNEEERRYLSYLLRLWQIESGRRLVWRASLEDARTGERRGFTSIDALLVFIRRQTSTARDADKVDA